MAAAGNSEGDTRPSGVLVDLTVLGRNEVGNLFDLLASNVESALDGMTSDERAAVARFLDRIHASFERRGEEEARE